MLKTVWWCLLLSAIIVSIDGVSEEDLVIGDTGNGDTATGDTATGDTATGDAQIGYSSTGEPLRIDESLSATEVPPTVDGTAGEPVPIGDVSIGEASTGDTSTSATTEFSEEEMVKILEEYNKEAMKICRTVSLASWDAVTDVTNKTKQNKHTEVVGQHAVFAKEWYNKYFKNAKNNNYSDESIRRQLYFLNQLGTSALAPDRLKMLTDTVSTMTSIYNTATVCPYTKQNCSDDDPTRLTLDPDISGRFAESRDYDELEYLWIKWRDESGRKMRNLYRDYVDLMNEAAVLNDFKDASEYWKDDFEDPELEEHVDALWHEVEPLYNELHTYMRYKLLAIYGDKIDRNDENLPAHLFGNVWAQTWENLFEDTKPFKGGAQIDVTNKLKELKFDARKMFETADDFYMSLGLPTNNMSYTGKSIISKPTNVTIQCHASAWDLCDGKDFRIKMCTNINQEDLIVIHHEMGHIQYYIQYKDQPETFKKGANPGFHEAIGDTIALSVANPRHLVKIGLLDNYTHSEENDINALYLEALKRIAFLPFGLLIDKWRWNVFSGKIPTTDWNKHWWKLRKQYQKMSPPVPRTEDDFDPGAKFHVAANSQYISYFISHMLEFAFYKSLCIEAGEYDPANPAVPLHQCDFYKSTKAGEKLAAGLRLGGSKHWSEALKVITGQTEITADAILEYYKPLRKVLRQQTDRMKQEDEVRQLLSEYNEQAQPYCENVKRADWDQTTDVLNEAKKDVYVQMVAASADFVKNQYEKTFSAYKNIKFQDEKIKRQIDKMSRLETNALSTTKLNAFTNTVNDMISIYSTATICRFNDTDCRDGERMRLDPDIVDIMAQSRDPNELKYVWAMWHNQTGPPMKPLFKSYIELNNEAAKLNGFKDAGAMWQARYEDPNLVTNMKALWEKVKPLYLELHTYTKNQLNKIYGDEIVDPNSKFIPAHLLGNLWAQQWTNLYDQIKPFKNGSDIDITEALKRNNYTALKIFEEADRFFQSLGLESNRMSYTGESIIEQPTDRVIVCHASAWDFCNGKDFRIKQCAVANQRNFLTAHHEMGHIQYYIQYKDQPIIFRDGANPGFHEAIGDVMALSVSTPTHLKKINLLGDYKDTPDDNINALFRMALERVAFLPFGLLVDLYRYDLFAGNVPEQDWNKHWEQLREEYQLVQSPVPRSEYHFDAGGKFHVPSDYSYMAYFVAHIVEFQMYKSLCIAAGQYNPNDTTKPLHKCDLEGSKVAGQRLHDGLSVGSSKSWPDVLSIITNGETEISADAILEYFKPLQDFLQEQNHPSNFVHQISNTKFWYILGGFALLVVVVALLGYAIYYYNRK